MADWIAYSYAAAVTAGGVMGYVKKGSIMSGIMGLTFGSLAGYGAYQTSEDPAKYYLRLLESIIGLVSSKFTLTKLRIHYNVFVTYFFNFLCFLIFLHFYGCFINFFPLKKINLQVFCKFRVFSSQLTILFLQIYLS